jgi:hypothetical protein
MKNLTLIAALLFSVSTAAAKPKGNKMTAAAQEKLIMDLIVQLTKKAFNSNIRIHKSKKGTELQFACQYEDADSMPKVAAIAKSLKQFKDIDYTVRKNLHDPGAKRILIKLVRRK